MLNLLDTCKDAIAGVVSGFDRVVFQGRHRLLQFSEGAQSFFDAHKILYKDAKKWMQAQTQQLVNDVERYSLEHCGNPILSLPSSRVRKEEVAHEQQTKLGITTGLIGAWSCLEACQTYEIRPASGRPVLIPKQSRCKHLYLYLDHPRYGFMNIRLQTWFPYMIQIAINGREWLAKQLDAKGIDFQRYRNKFLEIDNYQIAQRCLRDQAAKTDWIKMLNQFVPLIFPSHDRILGDRYRYSWYAWQSEWATDYIFTSTDALNRVMESVFHHALLTGTTDSILRYFDRETNRNGLLRQNAGVDVSSRLLHFADGARIKHWLNGNSVKAYNQLNNLRVETTINQPAQFKARRPIGPDQQERNMPLRKSVVDMSKRAHISENINKRMASALVTTGIKAEKINTTLAAYRKPKTVNGRRVRALDVFGKDHALLSALFDPRFEIAGFTNKDIRAALKQQPQYRGKTDKQLAGYVSRAFRLLRDHGLIRKYPRQHRYQLNDKGRQLTTAAQAILQTDITDLMALAA